MGRLSTIRNVLRNMVLAARRQTGLFVLLLSDGLGSNDLQGISGSVHTDVASALQLTRIAEDSSQRLQ